MGRKMLWVVGAAILLAAPQARAQTVDAPDAFPAPVVPAAAPLPNLVPLPPLDVWVGHADGLAEAPPHAVLDQPVPGVAPPPRALRFTSIVQNRGSQSLELVARLLPDPAHASAFATRVTQCMRFAPIVVHGAARGCLEYQDIGAGTYHPGHQHLHIPDFVRYELRRDAGGRSDMTPSGLVAQSVKSGTCLADLWNWRQDPVVAVDDARVQEAVDRVAPPPERAWYTECGTAGLFLTGGWRQGISPGWAAVSPPYAVGQQLPLAGVSDGVYWIVSAVNAATAPGAVRVIESTTADNVTASRVQLYGGGKKAKLLGPAPAEPYTYWFDNPPDQPGS